MKESGENNPPCPICGGRAIKWGWRMTRDRGVVRKYQCKAKGHFFLEPRPKEAEP
jgi:predicted RNA-binding Zn-ribbon protein involved in translation (DUF1610 family)